MANTLTQSIQSTLDSWYPKPLPADGQSDADAEIRSLFLVTFEGATNGGRSSFDPAAARELIEKHGITPEIAAANFNRLHEPHKRSELLQQRDEVDGNLVKARARLEDRQTEIDAMMKEWQSERQQLELAIRDLEMKHGSIVTAEGDQYATSIESREAVELNQELQSIHPKIAQLKIQLDEEHSSLGDSPGLLPSADRRPARLSAYLRAKLNDKRLGLSAERKKELKGAIKSADRRCKELELRLIKLEKRRQQIERRQREIAPERLKPQNFKVIREIEPSADEQKKAHARQFSMHDGPVVSLHTGGN